MLTYGSLRAIRDAGLSIPDDVALVGCDSWRSPELFEPFLTVVDRDASEIGRRAATLLIESIASGAVANITLPTTLVVGSTTATAARPGAKG
jgi:LacI family transcriptional regulator